MRASFSWAWNDTIVDVLRSVNGSKKAKGSYFKRCAITILRVFSMLLVCMRGRPAASRAAGVQADMDGTKRAARLLRDLHKSGKVLKMGWRTAGSLPVSWILPRGTPASLR